MRPLAIGGWVVLLAGCGGEPAGGDSGTASPVTSGTGVLELTFRMNDDYFPQMDAPAVGVFYGAFWRGSEVTSLGPDDGAEDLGSIEVAVVDLQVAGGPTGVLFTSPPLPVEEVVVLGFLDVDGNADTANPDPDDKDPVTLPNDNDFDVVGDASTVVEVYFGLLNP